jgi:H+-transporting ATPase
LSVLKKQKRLLFNELLQRLSSSEKGLSGSEAKQRLQQYGYNEIAEKRVSSILKLLSYFWGPIPWMIEVAAVLSGMVRHFDMVTPRHQMDAPQGTTSD